MIKFSEYKQDYRKVHLSDNYFVFFSRIDWNAYDMRMMFNDINFGNGDWKFKDRKDFLNRKGDILSKSYELLYKKKEFILKKIFRDD